MPPQVGKAGPLVQRAPVEVEEIKSKTVEQDKGESKNETLPEAQRATPKDTSRKMAEMSATSMAQEIKLKQWTKKENIRKDGGEQTKTEKQPEGNVWESVKSAVQTAADVANAGIGVIRDTAENVGIKMKQEAIEKKMKELDDR